MRNLRELLAHLGLNLEPQGKRNTGRRNGVGEASCNPHPTKTRRVRHPKASSWIIFRSELLRKSVLRVASLNGVFYAVRIAGVIGRDLFERGAYGGKLRMGNDLFS